MATKKSAKKKAAPKKKTAKKKTTTNKAKVIDEPLNIVYYKQGDLIDNYEILEEAAARTKKKNPMPFDIKWQTKEAEITLHILGGIALEKKARKK